jgi:hypothetical protein
MPKPANTKTATSEPINLPRLLKGGLRAGVAGLSRLEGCASSGRFIEKSSENFDSTGLLLGAFPVDFALQALT